MMTGPNPNDSTAGGQKLQNGTLTVEEPYLDPSDLPIHKAAYRGDASSLASLVESIDDIDVRSSHNCTPLQLAIRGNQVDSVNVLLAAGADPDLLDYADSAYMQYYAAVNLAAWCGSTQVLEVLIDRGLAVPTLSLSLAASLGRVDCVRTILRKLDAKKFSDGSRTDGVRSALRRAAMCWHVKTVKVLMTEVEGFPDQSIADRACLTNALFDALDDFDCDDRCRSWQTPDHPNQLLSMLDTFINNGADLNAIDPVSGMSRFWTIAGRALQLELGSVVCFLLARGLRTDEGSHTNDVLERSPPLIDVVARVSDADPIKAMLAAGANVTAIDKDGSTALHLAKSRAIAECLVDHGADLLAKDDQGRSALHVACQEMRVEVVDFLISKGANVNDAATEEPQWTPLHFATCGEAQPTWDDFVPLETSNQTSTNRLEIVKLLLKHGADLEAATSDGRTALHGAAQKGDVDVVRHILENGANIRATARGSQNVLHLICLQPPPAPKMIPIAQMLLDHGAELEAKNEAGATPLYLLLDVQKLDTRYPPDFFNFLLQRGADKFASVNSGKRVIDLINSEDWIFDEAGMLCVEPRRQQERMAMTARAIAERGRGRGHGHGRGRGRGQFS